MTKTPRNVLLHEIYTHDEFNPAEVTYIGDMTEAQLFVYLCGLDQQAKKEEV